MAEHARPRLTRLLGIVTYLEDHGSTPFADLADHFGVTVDQIRADVNTLWMSGLPGQMPDDLIDFDFDDFSQDIASITNTQGARQIRLSPREGIAVIAALSEIVATGSAPRAASSALEKLTAALGEEPLTVIGVAQPDAEVVRVLMTAVASRHAVQLDYVDAGDRRTERTIEPHRVVTIDGLSYVECYCRRAADYRTLRVDRIAHASATEIPIETPASDSEGFSLAATFQSELRLDRAGRWAVEDIPGVVIEDDGEALVVLVGVVDVGWTAARLISVAPLLHSVEPDALRDALARHAHAVLAAQGG